MIQFKKWQVEYEKCIKDPHYFYLNYVLINGEKPVKRDIDMKEYEILWSDLKKKTQKELAILGYDIEDMNHAPLTTLLIDEPEDLHPNICICIKDVGQNTKQKSYYRYALSFDCVYVNGMRCNMSYFQKHFKILTNAEAKEMGIDVHNFNQFHDGKRIETKKSSPG